MCILSNNLIFLANDDTGHSAQLLGGVYLLRATKPHTGTSGKSMLVPSRLLQKAFLPLFLVIFIHFSMGPAGIYFFDLKIIPRESDNFVKCFSPTDILGKLY